MKVPTGVYWISKFLVDVSGFAFMTMGTYFLAMAIAAIVNPEVAEHGLGQAWLNNKLLACCLFSILALAGFAYLMWQNGGRISLKVWCGFSLFVGICFAVAFSEQEFLMNTFGVVLFAAAIFYAIAQDEKKNTKPRLSSHGTNESQD